MTRIRLNNVDLAWLRMETPFNPMMITVLIHLKGRINHEMLISTISEFLNKYRRFHQRIVKPQRIFQRPYWEDDPDYSVRNHIEMVDLRLPADEAALQELVNTKINTQLDFNRPLWKVTLIENFPGDSLIIVRIHHCIADGISLMQVLLSMTQTEQEVLADNTSPTAIGTAQEISDLRQSPLPGANSKLSVPASASDPTIVNAMPETGQTIEIRNPTVSEILAASARIIFRSADPPTILKRPLGTTKKAVWSQPYSVREIKSIARYRQATINDVFMAVTTGAIRRYMEVHQDQRQDNIRAFIMVNLRGRSFDSDLGNNFGLVFLTLPLDRTQSIQRLEAIKDGMDTLKASAEYAATYIILNILGVLPKWIEDLAIRILDRKGTVVSTNVPGPRSQIYLAGTPIRSLIAWVPQSGRIGVGLSFVSYNDQLIVGLNADFGVLPDPERFLQLFYEEYCSLKTAIEAQFSQSVEFEGPGG